MRPPFVPSALHRYLTHYEIQHSVAQHTWRDIDDAHRRVERTLRAGMPARVVIVDLTRFTDGKA